MKKTYRLLPLLLVLVLAQVGIQAEIGGIELMARLAVDLGNSVRNFEVAP